MIGNQDQDSFPLHHNAADYRIVRDGAAGSPHA